MSRLLGSLVAVVFACSVAMLYADRAEAEVGLASWYVPAAGYEGEYAASHDTLPIGTQLTVSYGGRWTVVTVTGRGPGIPGRELDISQAAAQQIGLTEVGVDYVEYTYAGEGAQAGGTGSYADAEYYTVRPGDTLSSVASLYAVSVRRLAAANDIGAFDMLYSGQTLIIPQGGGAAGGARSGAGYRKATWYPASEYGNYTAANRPASNRIKRIVVHTTEGPYESALGWFQDPASGVSAHYTVGTDGSVAQSVSERNIAHHAGNWRYNQTSVGIEHEGYVADPYSYTNRMYRSSARVGAHIVNKYGIPINRRHIVGHNEVPSATHTDPGPYWNWGRYLGYMERYAGASGY